MSIRENYLEICQNIADAAKQAGRRAEDITLVAVSKFVDEERIRLAHEAGANVFGESRAQELGEKMPMFEELGADVHFIGQLQTNKVKQVVGKVDLIQSVDSLRLLEAIDREAERQGLTQAVLLEVNIGGEASKRGFAKEEILPAVEKMANFAHIFVRGLMTVPPICQEVAESQEFFSEISALWSLPRSRLRPRLHNQHIPRRNRAG